MVIEPGSIPGHKGEIEELLVQWDNRLNNPLYLSGWVCKGTEYDWWLWVANEHGIGESYYYRTVRFANTGGAGLELPAAAGQPGVPERVGAIPLPKARK